MRPLEQLAPSPPCQVKRQGRRLSRFARVSKPAHIFFGRKICPSHPPNHHPVHPIQGRGGGVEEKQSVVIDSSKTRAHGVEPSQWYQQQNRKRCRKARSWHSYAAVMRASIIKVESHSPFDCESLHPGRQPEGVPVTYWGTMLMSCLHLRPPAASRPVASVCPSPASRPASTQLKATPLNPLDQTRHGAPGQSAHSNATMHPPVPLRGADKGVDDGGVKESSFSTHALVV